MEKVNIVELRFDGRAVSVLASKSYVKHLLSIFEAEGYTKEKVVEALDFGRSTFFDVINEDKKINKSTFLFIEKAFHFINNNFSCNYLYDSAQDLFVPVRAKNNQQFLNGVYYGYFKKSDNSELLHFVLVVKGLKVDMWTAEKVSHGDIVYDLETYTIILRDTRNSKNMEFVIGRKTDSPRKKLFINTWRTDDCNIHSALCLILYIDKPLFKTIEEIRVGRKQLRPHIMANTPDWVDAFFNDQKHKFIRKELSDHEHEHY